MSRRGRVTTTGACCCSGAPRNSPIPVADLLAEVERQHSTPTEVSPSARATRIVRPPLGVNDGKGILFITHQGDVQPSGFLNLVGGNIRSQSLADIYRDSPVFRRVRDYTQLKGKCGLCEFKNICGGSRARAFALTGDIWRSDPFCVFQPAAWNNRNAPANRRRQAENYAAGLH